MSAPSIDIKDMLVAETSLSLVYKTNLFIERMPTSPDSVVVIYTYPGYGTDLTYNRAEIYERPSIQIQVRDYGFTNAFNLLKTIKDLLHGRGAEAWNNSRYTVIRCMTEPALLTFDDNARAIVFANFDLQRDQT